MLLRVLMLGLLLSPSLYLSVPEIPFLAGMFLGIDVFVTLWISEYFRHTSFAVKFVLSLMALTASTAFLLGTEPFAVFNGAGSLYGPVARIFLVETAAVIVWWAIRLPRNVGRITVFLLRPGEPFPLLRPEATSNVSDAIIAIRLLSPDAISRYRGIDLLPTTTWVDSYEGSTSRPVKNRVSNGINQFVVDDLWGVCRYVLRRFMEGESEIECKEPSCLSHNPWRIQGAAAYFTAKLHLTQLKSYALLVAGILLIAGFAHSLGENTFSGHELRIDTKAHAVSEIPIAVAGLALVWAAGAWGYRRYQIERVARWEMHCRSSMDNSGLKLFHLCPDTEGSLRWYEVNSVSDIRSPVTTYGLTGERVFHVIDGVLLVVLLEFLHFLHL